MEHFKIQTLSYLFLGLVSVITKQQIRFSKSIVVQIYEQQRGLWIFLREGVYNKLQRDGYIFDREYLDMQKSPSGWGLQMT